MYMNEQERGITGPQRGSQRNEASASMAEKLQGVCLLSSHQLGTLEGVIHEGCKPCARASSGVLIFYRAHLRGSTSMWEKLGLNFNGSCPCGQW